MYNEPVSISRLMRPLKRPIPMNAARHDPRASRSSDFGPLGAVVFIICVGKAPANGTRHRGESPRCLPRLRLRGAAFPLAARLHQILVHNHQLTALDQIAADFLMRLGVDQERVLAGVAQNIGDIDHARGTSSSWS